MSRLSGTIAAVLPLYNEERAIGVLLSKFTGQVAEVVVVDDGSTDRGAAIARAHGVHVLEHHTRRGVGAAIRTGLRYVRAQGHWGVVILAANGKDDPREIPTLTAALAAGHDFVQGSRFIAGGSHRNLPLQRNVLIRAYGLVFRVLTGRRVTDVTNGFRAYRTELLSDPRIDLEQAWLDTYELEYYLQYKVLTLGYRFVEVPVSKTYPSSGTYSKIRPVADWWRMIRPVLFLALRLRR